MKFHILTLFPDMVLNGLHTSIIGRAAEKKIIEINAVNIRDYTMDKHGKADDYPYGGGAGMLMQAQPVFDAYQAAASGRKLRTVYVTPQGVPFTQKLAEELAGEEELVFLCGHYEGIDERVLEELVTDCVSIGDYVLTGGELAAMVMTDAISRLVPGVLNNDVSAETESFHNDLLEYPQYSRPEVWRGKKVPEVLLGGNHKEIAKWRLEQSVERTKRVRPDLYQKYQEKQRLIRFLSKEKRNNIHMMESLARGKAEILYARGGNVLLYDRSAAYCMLTAQNEEEGKTLLKRIPAQTKLITSSQEFLNHMICQEMPFEVLNECVQVCYPQKQTLPVKYKDIRPLEEEHAAYVTEHYAIGGAAYIRERIAAGAMYGAFLENRLLGFVGVHNDGSMGMLFVDEAHRGQGLALSLEAYCINRICEKNMVPYGHIVTGNEASLRLQEKLGLYPSSGKVWWLERK